MLAVLLACSSLWGQSGVEGCPTCRRRSRSSIAIRTPTCGSIPQGKATPGILDLTIEDALDRGLKYNLGLYLAARVDRPSRAPLIFGPSATCCRWSTARSASEDQKLNLKQFGFTFPGISHVGGSFRPYRSARNRSLDRARLPFHQQHSGGLAECEGRAVHLPRRARHGGAGGGRELPADHRPGIARDRYRSGTQDGAGAVPVGGGPGKCRPGAPDRHACARGYSCRPSKRRSSRRRTIWRSSASRWRASSDCRCSRSFGW